MRISDWSSDVCSSDLFQDFGEQHVVAGQYGVIDGVRDHPPLGKQLRGPALQRRKLREVRSFEPVAKIVREQLVKAIFAQLPGHRRKEHALRSEEHTYELQTQKGTEYACCSCKQTTIHKQTSNIERV